VMFLFIFGIFIFDFDGRDSRRLPFSP